MSKDVNIHLKTTGAEQTKEQLGQVASGTQKIGGEAQRSGSETEKGLGRVSGALAKLVGPLALGAIAAKLADMANRVGAFFDNIKTKADEAVEHTRGLRREFDDLFEAMNAFDEKGRRMVTETALTQMQKTGTPRDIGIPIIDAYTRQFKTLIDAGQITQAEYERGLEEMLSYGAVHGGAATPELIRMMSGWGMAGPEQQGAFRRQIAASAQAVGLTDEDIITALTRGGPTVKAMGWTPGYAVEMIAKIAAGEAGRTLTTLPAATLQAVMAPQPTKATQYGLEEKLFEQPAELLAKVAEMKAAGPIKRLKPALKKGAPPEYEEVEFRTMLMDIYGVEAAKGVQKILTGEDRNLAAIGRQAAAEQGVIAERREWEAYRTTQEFREAATQAKTGRISQRINSDEDYMRDVRAIGEEKLKQLRREEPISQWLRTKYFGPQEAAQEEYGAYRQWEEELSEEEKQKTVEEYEGPGRYFVLPVAVRRAALVQRWKQMTAQQKYESLTVVPEPGKQQATPPKRMPQPVSPELGESANAAGMIPDVKVAFSSGPRGELATSNIVNNYDQRVSHIMVLNPITGMNKQDLGIEPPRLG